MEVEVVQPGTGGEYGSGVEVKEGPLTVVLDEPWRQMPQGTVFTGTLKFGENRIFGRFDHARTPDGHRYPICVQAYQYGEAPYCARPGVGICPATGSSPGHYLLWQRFSVAPTKDFGEEE
ncbi:hypothetical protein ACN28S_17570 [Cystobacter fuscus]